NLTEEAEASGQQFTEENAKAAAEFTDALNKLTQSAKGIVYQLGAAVAPALTQMLNDVQPLVTATVGWVSENQELVAGFAKAAAVLTGTGGLLVAGGKLLAIISSIKLAAPAAAAGVTNIGNASAAAAGKVSTLNARLA